MLSETHFDAIQSSVDKFITPADIGRIPHKISSLFSLFTADQWKNWTLIYSTIVLKPVIPNEHYQCWCLFVEACHLLCSRAISHSGVTCLDSLFLCFCEIFSIFMVLHSALLIYTFIVTSRNAYLILDLQAHFGRFHLRGLMEC